ncbi:acyl-CoA desaturase [Poriferisphaera sp. WC338]|uniref:acyl-CoA desaturase n=1 Tax=Poriferisphaera sp. WC338 TaxID=3425129 RepID=UPI003D819792
MPVTTEVADHRPKRGGIAWRELSLPVIIAIGGMHVIALLALWPALFTWSGLAMFVFFFWLSGGIGINLCYHRLMTHRSFKTPKWFERVLLLIASLAWQGGPVNWVGVHRLHHKHSDTDHDPHSPKHGFTWSHILWMMHKEVEGVKGSEAAKDLLRDTFIRRLDRFFWVPQIALAGLLFLAGWLIASPMLGLSWVVWGVALRTAGVFHVTWFVNSAAHTWGYQNYKNTHENSTNLWWVALLSFGEGWHNNHHAHPRSAAHGLRWFEVDMTYWTIKALSWVGLIWEIQIPAEEKMPSYQAPKPIMPVKIAPDSTSTARAARLCGSASGPE